MKDEGEHYQQGDVTIGVACPNLVVDKPGYAAYCDCENEDHSIRLGGLIYLPHSCDEWVIGTKEDAEQLIADLQQAIKQI